MSTLPIDERIVEKATELLGDVFEEHDIPQSHGLNHALSVLGNMRKAMELIDNSKPVFNRCFTLSLKLASLLHDADDRKYFDENSNNTTKILEEALKEDEELKKKESSKIVRRVVQMISYVSASSHGDSMTPETKNDNELLWVRHCDRLEAMGTIGVVRCYQYSTETDRVLFTAETPRPTTEEELWALVTPEKFANY